MDVRFQNIVADNIAAVQFLTQALNAAIVSEELQGFRDFTVESFEFASCCEVLLRGITDANIAMDISYGLIFSSLVSANLARDGISERAKNFASSYKNAIDRINNQLNPGPSCRLTVVRISLILSPFVIKIMNAARKSGGERRYLHSPGASGAILASGRMSPADLSVSAHLWGATLSAKTPAKRVSEEALLASYQRTVDENWALFYARIFPEFDGEVAQFLP